MNLEDHPSVQRLARHDQGNQTQPQPEGNILLRMDDES